MKPKFLVTTFREYKDETEKFYQECERKTHVEPTDTLIVALSEEKPIGIVRLCFENQAYVLRTMQIHPEVQRQGIGSVILEKFDQVLKDRNIVQIFCMPYDHLESFYGQIGFRKISVGEAPEFLQERLADFFRKYPTQKAILMERYQSM